MVIFYYGSATMDMYRHFTEGPAKILGSGYCSECSRPANAHKVLLTGENDSPHDTQMFLREAKLALCRVVATSEGHKTFICYDSSVEAPDCMTREELEELYS